jgi:hypothetical protein
MTLYTINYDTHEIIGWSLSILFNAHFGTVGSDTVHSVFLRIPPHPPSIVLIERITLVIRSIYLYTSITTAPSFHLKM